MSVNARDELEVQAIRGFVSDLVTGYAGVATLGHATLFGAGAYAAGIAAAKFGITDPLLAQLRDEYRIEVSINAWPEWPSRLLRVSAQLYNDLSQYEVLGAALGELLASEVGRARR